MMKLNQTLEEENNSIIQFQKRLSNYINQKQIVIQMKKAFLSVESDTMRSRKKSYLIYWPSIEEEVNTMTCIYESKFEETNKNKFHLVRKLKLKKKIIDNKYYKECKCRNHYKDIPLDWNEFIFYNVVKLTYKSFNNKRLRNLSIDYIDNTINNIDDNIQKYKKLKSSNEELILKHDDDNNKEEEEKQLLYLKPFPILKNEELGILEESQILKDFFNMNIQSLENKYKLNGLLDKFSNDNISTFNYFQNENDALLHEVDNIRIKSFNLDGTIIMHKTEKPYLIFISNAFMNMYNINEFRNVSIYSSSFSEIMGIISSSSYSFIFILINLYRYKRI